VAKLKAVSQIYWIGAGTTDTARQGAQTFLHGKELGFQQLLQGNIPAGTTGSSGAISW